MENKEITIDDLAVMIKNGFDNVDKKIEQVRAEIKSEIKTVNDKLVVLERGQEDIKLRQDSSAYRFELKSQEETLEKHDVRIGVLEEKVLMTS